MDNSTSRVFRTATIGSGLSATATTTNAPPSEPRPQGAVIFAKRIFRAATIGSGQPAVDSDRSQTEAR